MNQPITIILADDDDDQCELVRAAFEKAQLHHLLFHLKSGEDLLDFLLARNEYKDRVLLRNSACLVLLDLDMPVMGGRETLRVLKSDKVLRKLPVLVMTGSDSDEEIIRAYDLGVNSFIRKPFSYDEFMRVVAALKLFWIEIALIPRISDLPGRLTDRPEEAAIHPAVSVGDPPADRR